ncbi:MAG TPA: hemerythrin domain-containing protein [Streptosporangiaceae bacterium]|nr:hemerythrin domain-containing protein [Streptosporangiaceae bacterium]
MTDIIELILADHRRIRRLQAGLRAAARLCGSEPSWVLPRTWNGLAEVIEVHLAAEEEICWPVLSVAWPDGPARLREVAADGEDIRAAIAGAALQPAGSPGWWRAVNDALRDCSSCLDREERGLLGILARQAGPALRNQLGRQWLAFLAAHSRDKAIAVPSPRVGQMRAGNGVPPVGVT